SGKRFWQRTPVPLLATPKFDYRPAQYRPKPLPVQSALKIASVAILVLGVFGAYQSYKDQSDSLAFSVRTQGILEQQIVSRSLQVEKTREARELLDVAKRKTERLIAANDVIQDRAAGFPETMAVISALTPEDVRLISVDDDGRIVGVNAEADDYPILIEFIRLLEAVPQFVHVQVHNLSRSSVNDSGSTSGPADQAGGEVVSSQTSIKMSVEIRRVKIMDSDSALKEELATGGVGR
ncbi:MAG: PilN domain-containing protein, partial [Chloroflexi bacterium]|nr:PilN domain-containing protein [Chloroflexota bacterium]